ncbi:hypothetical protein TCAL_04595 [Tigriopus californicus]|uniref:Uncharacterized protein n=1 Tax=Tigriopus californicus TaxID=6832 RepID=A0A553PA74_TIGCA|nr:hypothetical protein TCAL_04595 [Tigriopus californicus]
MVVHGILGVALLVFTTNQDVTAQSINNYIPYYEKPTYNCTIPRVVQGEWYSREKNLDTVTIIDASQMQRRGICVEHETDYTGKYTFLFSENPKDRSFSEEPTLENVCSRLNPLSQIITLFAENYTPINCRSSLEGVFHFAYQNRFSFTGECRHPEQQIHSCQDVGSQFLIANQKFNLTYRKCEGMSWTFDGVVEYSCLGDWFVGKDHFFAVANTKESRKDEKFRCFLKNREDDYYLGASITPECNVLKTIEKSPERYRLKPVRSQTVEPGCLLPENFTGEWINTANIDADVWINSTHIVETWHPDVSRWRKAIYICMEQRDSRFMMARLTIDGCQVDYQCFDFVPRHHNVIRFRKGVAMIMNDFHTVCSWVQFKNDVRWKYDLMLRKDPVPIRCPVAGAFNFTQQGDFQFQTRILGGITKDPRHDVWGRTGQFSCKQNISRLAVCDTDQKEITIDETYCWSTDHLGRPIDIYSEADYRMQCIGYWKENLKSYLITYDQLDAFTKYRCWVYQRADLNKMLMSMSVGPYCDLAQDVDSGNWTEGAVVSLVMDENEREFDRCPMYFNDGEDPWKVEENHIRVFNFNDESSGANLTGSIILIVALALGASQIK